MPQGQIVRTQSNFYYVESKGQVLECKARGIFKQRKITPLVGDYVSYDIVNESQGFITDISPRKNELIRPPISNVDQAILVFSLKEPNFSTLLLDKFLVHVEKAKIVPIICITKHDLIADANNMILDKVDLYKNIGYKVIITSKFTDQGINDLKEVLKDKISVFSGQSGVGKSTLLNKLLPALKLETADISQKLGRGKHTTRFTQLITLPYGGMVADTPGFSQLDFTDILPEDLSFYFVEFDQYSEHCKFRGCIHLNEPGCAVKSAVLENKISEERYEHYLEFLHEIKEREQNKWR